MENTRGTAMPETGPQKEPRATVFVHVSRHLPTSVSFPFQFKPSKLPWPQTILVQLFLKLHQGGKGFESPIIAISALSFRMSINTKRLAAPQTPNYLPHASVKPYFIRYSKRL